MQHSTLSQHEFKKGKFITPFNKAFTELLKENSWFYGRLPEYIWIGLIIRYYGRDEGISKCMSLLEKLSEFKDTVFSPRFSNILKLSTDKQTEIFDYFKSVVDVDVLSPLTVIFTYSDYPCFSSSFYTNASPEERISLINEVVAEASHHQSEFSTDMRFIVLYYLIVTDRLNMPKTMLNSLLMYPKLQHSDKRMNFIRPTIRAAEIGIPTDLDGKDDDYIYTFWEGVSRLSECELFYIEIAPNHEGAEDYIARVKTILEYYKEVFVSAKPLDNKMLVILGIATYSYKRLLEVVEHDLYQTISGRSISRVLVENYIMLKYLLKNESSHNDIWAEYQFYGIGQYKLISERYIESGKNLPDSHVPYDLIDILVSEYKSKEFIDMDTTYFDKTNIRIKADSVGEKELYGLYYDYDSAFEHGLWGAIRESSLIKCNTPSHQFHCVPDIENVQKMQDVWCDCKTMMDKTLDVLKDIYGLPDRFEEEIQNE